MHSFSYLQFKNKLIELTEAIITELQRRKSLDQSQLDSDQLVITLTNHFYWTCVSNTLKIKYDTRVLNVINNFTLKYEFICWYDMVL